MVDKILYVITVPMVYLALAWLVLGVIARIVMVLRAPAHPHTLKIFPERKAAPLVALWESFTMPTVRKNKPLFWVFLMLFHLGFGALILSHLDLLPQISLMPKDSPRSKRWPSLQRQTMRRANTPAICLTSTLWPGTSGQFKSTLLDSLSAEALARRALRNLPGTWLRVVTVPVAGERLT